MASVYQSNDTITVSYPVREATQTISKTDYFAIRSIGEHNKVRAIKFVRMLTGLGLCESKQIVDTILAHPDVLTPPQWGPFHNTAAAQSLGALLRAKLDSERA